MIRPLWSTLTRLDILPARKTGISATTGGRAVGSRFTGPATRSPPRASTACPAAVYNERYSSADLALADTFECSTREVQVNEPSVRAKQRAASREAALAGVAIRYP